MTNEKELWAICPECGNYFRPRETSYPCPNCGEAGLVESDVEFPLLPKKETPADFLTLAAAMDLDGEWAPLRRQISTVWRDQVAKKFWYRGNVERKVRYLREEGHRYLAGRVDFFHLRNFSNTALKLLVGIVWVKKIHPFGRYSCKCRLEGLQPRRAEHRCRRSYKDGGLCGTCLLPVDSRGCWLCRSCGGVLVWEAADWNLLIPKVARDSALNQESK